MTIISLVIPIFNESESLSQFYQEISQALEALNQDYEILFIDDGSTDETGQMLEDLQRKDPHFEMIRLRRNFGKSMALAIGFQKAKGDIILTMDSDLQDDPKEIPRFIEEINKGADLVCGWKKERQDPLEKRIASAFFNWIVGMASGLKIHDFNCGFKAYKQKVVKTIHVYGEFHRFIPILVQSYGFKIKEIAVHHRKRTFGKSKYGLGRYLAGLFDFLSAIFVTGYLRKPMHFLGRISLTSFLVGFFLVSYVAYMKLGLGQTGNRPSLTIGVFLIGFSIQVFIFGLLADFMSYFNQKVYFSSEDFIEDSS